MLYPINLNLAGKKCLVVGGGIVAERKILGLLEAGAKVTVLSPVVTERLVALAAENALTWVKDAFTEGAVKGYFLLIAATNNNTVNKSAIIEARKAGVLVNAPANPTDSDFFVPAVLRRGDLLVAVSTEGASPAFSRVIKEEIAGFLPNNIEEWLKILKKIRAKLKKSLQTSRDREFFWRKALNKKVLKLLREGRLKDAEVELRNGFSCDGS